MPIVRWVAILLGWIMNGIYVLLDKCGIPNIGLAIIIFTLVIYILMTPIQISQQKSSKMMSLIAPETQAIAKKYEGKRDMASQQKMQEETRAVYDKYGVNMMGSCGTMIITLPVLFGLYQVILFIPGYISSVGAIFSPLAEKIANTSGAFDVVANFIKENSMRVLTVKDALTTENVTDFLYALKPAQWTKFQEISMFSSMKGEMTTIAAKSARISTFLGINISDSPWDVIKSGFAGIVGGSASGALIFALIIAILIPFLAWFTQWLNMKLMPQQASQENAEGGMMGQMNTMLKIMPLFSAFICFTLSMGIGIYWVFGGIIRCVQQVVINRRIAKMDIEEIIAKAKIKSEKKKKKDKDYVANITDNARTNVKRIQNSKSQGKDIDSSQFYRDSQNINPDSLTAKANRVREFDQRTGGKGYKKK